MAINPHDDYEALAKLLYPSIEASGNVYYGQTRKLTMDETLGKNDLGFESHVESIRVSDDNADYGYHYDNYLCWSIGSLKGSFKVDEFSDILYAKYKLIITDKEVSNSLHSGSYNTYEKNVDLRLAELTTSDDLVDIFSDGRNFYVDQVGSDVYLYIVACPLNGIATYNDNNALRLTAVNDSVTISLVYRGFDSLDDKPEYQYRKNGAGEWIIIDWQNSQIVLNANEYIQVKLSNSFTDFSEYKNIYFTFYGDGSIKASGDIRSMLGTSDKQMYSYCYYGMFDGCASLLNAPRLPATELTESCYSEMFRYCTGLITAPDLPATELADHCYERMFRYCTGLITAPDLPATELTESCYSEMFSHCSGLITAPVINASLSSENSHSCFYEMFRGCSSLIKAPRIRLDYLPDYCCDGMFDGCTQLSEVCIDATSIYYISSLNNWLYGVSSSGTFYCKPNANIFDTDSPSGIPTGWTRKSIDDYYEEDIHGGEYSRGIMITSGYNSPGNGRGDITSSGTVSNMEQSFDENKTHQMGTYNSDGSLNQEVWGYKSFNSPVQFRNGIYGECASLIASGQLNVINKDFTQLSVGGPAASHFEFEPVNYTSSGSESMFTNREQNSSIHVGLYKSTASCCSVINTFTGNTDIIYFDTDANVSQSRTVIRSRLNDKEAYIHTAVTAGEYPDVTLDTGYSPYEDPYIADKHVTLNNIGECEIKLHADNIYFECDSVNGNIIPGTNELYNLGSSDKRYNTVYSKDINVDGTLNGKLPIAKLEGGAPYVPSNSIFLALIQAQDEEGQTIVPGSSFTAGNDASSIRVYFADCVGNTGSPNSTTISYWHHAPAPGGDTPITGKFIALSGATLNEGTCGIVLVMKAE